MIVFFRGYFFKIISIAYYALFFNMEADDF